MRLHCRDPVIGFQSVWELPGDRRQRLSELRHVWFRACWSAHKPHRLSPLGWFSPLEASATWAPNLDLHKQRKGKSTVTHRAPRQPLFQLPCALLYFSDRNWSLCPGDRLFGIFRPCPCSPESWVGSAHRHWQCLETRLSGWHEHWVKSSEWFVGSHHALHCNLGWLWHMHMIPHQATVYPEAPQYVR